MTRREFVVLRNWLIAVAFVCFAVGGAGLIMAAINTTQTEARGTVAKGQACVDDYVCEGALMCREGQCVERPPLVGQPCTDSKDGLVCHGGVYTLPGLGDACGPIGCIDGTSCQKGVCSAMG